MIRSVHVICLCFIASVAFGSEGTTVYKSKDKSGNPVFTDRETATSEEIRVQDPLTFPAEVIKQRADTFGYDGISSDAENESPVVYNALQISSPQDQQSIRDNAGNLTVDVVAPRTIAPEHQLVLLMDGIVIAVYSGEPFALANLDRGEHTLQLQISHTESGEIYKSSQEVTFIMLRFSQLHRKKPTPH